MMPNATTSDAQYTDVVKKYRDVTLHVVVYLGIRDYGFDRC